MVFGSSGACWKYGRVLSLQAVVPRNDGFCNGSLWAAHKQLYAGAGLFFCLVRFWSLALRLLLDLLMVACAQMQSAVFLETFCIYLTGFRKQEMAVYICAR